jgi:ZIP family zinc transporter
MINFFYELNPLIQTILASSITFFATSMGAFIVYLLKFNSKKLTNILLGIGAGIMLAAAFFSLLIPAIEQAKLLNFNHYIVISFSIIFGCIFLLLGDKVAVKYANSNGLMMMLSIILHNIPEGLSIGVAFGSALNNDMVTAALSLTIGIAIQNIPEGAAISVPLLNKGYSKRKSFLVGVLSAIVEPISAVIGYLLILKVTTLLPFLLAFAAGAMIFVVIKELIPESQSTDTNLVSILTIVGFIFMMLFEI